MNILGDVCYSISNVDLVTLPFNNYHVIINLDLVTLLLNDYYVNDIVVINVEDYKLNMNCAYTARCYSLLVSKGKFGVF